MNKVMDVVQYILHKSEPECGDIITNIKLQKLLYYCQGFSLALNNRKLFNENILNWMYGPVVGEVYGQCKQFANNGIDLNKIDGDCSKLCNDDKILIDDVYNVYGQFSAWKLKEMTHEEPPWKETTSNEIITTDSLRSFFKTLVINNA